MTRILTSTAMILALSAPVFAESHSASTTETDTQVTTETESTDMTTTESTDMAATDSADMNMEIGSVMATPTDFFASDLIGMRIYNVEADMDYSARVTADAELEWDDIGEINDVIVTADGKVSAVILGIGGFIGIGERDVSVPMSALNVVMEEGDAGDRFLVVQSTKEQLEAAPEFKRDNM